MNFTWYLRRLRAMDLNEVWGRLHNWIAQEYWRRRYYARETTPKPRAIAGERQFHTGLDRSLANRAPQAPRVQLLRFAAGLLQGHWPTFAIERENVTSDVDWHLDPKSGVRLPTNDYTFAIRTHGENIGFDTKYVWELSRHHHTTTLAMAYWLTGDERYAATAAEQVASWCIANPFLKGVHWSSGIELGIRLISFVWVRRLLEEWPQSRARFENDDAFVQLIYRHQWLLARRMSFGSSANNHLLYEAAGLYVSACAMPWFAESEGWRARAKALLEREFVCQSFPSGYNRELASEYNGFVLEALVLCLAEGELSGFRLAEAARDTADRIFGTLADLVDCRGSPPRQGDGDNAHGLLLDAPDYDRWADLLSLGATWFGHSARADHLAPPLRSWLLGRLVGSRRRESGGSLARVSALQDAGLAILRCDRGQEELYCVFDAGPLGYLAIAAHGHADALSIELRYGGQPILVDPGTYNYTAPRLLREYFRSTSAHNTLELYGLSQSESGGPFLWKRAAHAQLLTISGLDEKAPIATAEGQHDGYQSRFGLSHHRRVELDRDRRELTIEDRIVGASPAPGRLMFHLHPSVECDLTGHVAQLSWITESGRRRAKFFLPNLMKWQAISGSIAPMLGWYSPSYDVKIPTVTLVGAALVSDTNCLRSKFKFDVAN